MVWHVVPAPTAGALKRDFQEVTESVAMQKGYNPVLRVGNEVFNEANLYFSGPTFFDLFSFRLLAGDPENVLSDPYSVVISESVAERFFGNTVPLGKTLLLDNKQLLTITGILEDTPSNSHLKIDYLVPFSLLEEKGRNLEKWGNIDYITYIKLADNVNPEQFNRKIGGYLEDKNMFGTATLFINPLDRIHLYNDPGFENFSTGQNGRGPITRVIFFGLTGMLILILACINFINLATATAAGRARETGIRKVAGAGRADLMLRMFGESVLQTLVATAIAFLLAVLLAPLFERISGIEITEGKILNLKNITFSLVLMFITGLLAGTYPALVLSSFSPVRVLRPSLNSSPDGSRLRKALVIFQFVLTVIFVFSITVMSRQIHFMQNKKLGFDTEGIMVITLSRGTGDEANYDALMSELRSIAAVEAVAMGGGIPVNMGNFNTFNKWTGNETDKSLKFHMLQVDDDYLDLLGLEIVSGRPITRVSYNDEVVINQTAARQMDMEDPVGKLIAGNGKTYTIVGVVKDFYFRKLNEEIKPVLIYKNPEWWMRRILVRLSPGEQSEAIERISSVVKALDRKSVV